MSQRYDASAQAAQELGVLPLGVREPDDFNEASASMDRGSPDAILMVTDSVTLINRKRVFDYAAQHRLPAIYEQDFMDRDGGLMSYGAEAQESFRSRRCAKRPHFFKARSPRSAIRDADALPPPTSPSPQCCGFGDRGVVHVDPVAAAGAADITIAADRSIVRPQPEFAKKKSSTPASSRSAAQSAQADRSDRFARA
jgi:hypothetical protein